MSTGPLYPNSLCQVLFQAEPLDRFPLNRCFGGYHPFKPLSTPASGDAFKLSNGESEGAVAFFSTKHWNCRNRADLIESMIPCHDTQVVGSYRVSNPLHLTVLAAMSEDYTTVPQHLQSNTVHASLK